MITISNHNAKMNDVDVKSLPSALQNTYKNFDVLAKFYKTNDKMRAVLDMYLSKLNESLDSKKKPSATTSKTDTFDKKEVEKKPKFNTEFGKKQYRKNVVKKKVTKTSPTAPNFKKVENVDLELRIIKRYTLLHGKTKSKKQILTFLASMQNAMLKKEIRKSSKYAQEIMHIQDELISLLGFYGKSEESVIEVTIKEKILQKYKLLAGSQKVMTAVRFIARFNRLQGKEDVKLKSRALLKQIINAEKQGKIENYQEDIKQVKASLSEYINSDNSLKIKEESLKGLSSKKKDNLVGLGSIDNIGTIISSTNFNNVKFSPLGFEGKWLKLIGNPTQPFAMMTYARAGQGKSTMNISLAHYLAANQNKKVLYIAEEEKLGFTLQEKLKRLKAAHKNLYITDDMPKEGINKFDFVFMDSVNSMGLTPEELKDLRNDNPQTSFAYVFQATKDGNFKGNNEFAHDVDVVIEVDNGIAITEKSRFGGKGEIKVF